MTSDCMTNRRFCVPIDVVLKRRRRLKAYSGDAENISLWMGLLGEVLCTSSSPLSRNPPKFSACSVFGVQVAAWSNISSTQCCGRNLGKKSSFLGSSFENNRGLYTCYMYNVEKRRILFGPVHRQREKRTQATDTLVWKESRKWWIMTFVAVFIGSRDEYFAYDQMLTWQNR